MNLSASQSLGSGALSLSGGTIANTSGGPLALTNNVVNLNGSLVVGGSGLLNLTAGNVALSNSATVYLNGATPLIIGGAMTDNGTGLTINGPAFVALTGSSSGYTGPTSVNGGTLSVGNGGSGAYIGNSSGVNLAGNATIIFNHSDATSFAGAINGTGSLVQTGSGTLTLTGMQRLQRRDDLSLLASCRPAPLGNCRPRRR